MSRHLLTTLPVHLQIRGLWSGDFDVETLRVSTVFLATLDGQPLQMQKRIGEMFAPLLAVFQQGVTEAQRPKTAAERQDDLNKQAAAEQKAEPKACSR